MFQVWQIFFLFYLLKGPFLFHLFLKSNFDQLQHLLKYKILMFQCTKKGMHTLNKFVKCLNCTVTHDNTANCKINIIV